MVGDVRADFRRNRAVDGRDLRGGRNPPLPGCEMGPNNPALLGLKSTDYSCFIRGNKILYEEETVIFKFLITFDTSVQEIQFKVNTQVVASVMISSQLKRISTDLIST